MTPAPNMTNNGLKSHFRRIKNPRINKPTARKSISERADGSAWSPKKAVVSNVSAVVAIRATTIARSPERAPVMIGRERYL